MYDDQAAPRVTHSLGGGVTMARTLSSHRRNVHGRSLRTAAAHFVRISRGDAAGRLSRGGFRAASSVVGGQGVSRRRSCASPSLRSFNHALERSVCSI
jgi:hypothetical protein